MRKVSYDHFSIPVDVVKSLYYILSWKGGQCKYISWVKWYNSLKDHRISKYEVSTCWPLSAADDKLDSRKNVNSSTVNTFCEWSPR